MKWNKFNPNYMLARKQGLPFHVYHKYLRLWYNRLEIISDKILQDVKGFRP